MNQTTKATVVFDPVCGMTVNPERAAGKSEYGGHAHYFCSTSCKATFDEAPEEFIAPAAASGCCSSGTSCC